LVNSTINANKAENGELYYFASLSWCMEKKLCLTIIMNIQND
jgi:hypothetical protein